MELLVDLGADGGDGDLISRLYRGLLEAIRSGRLRAGDRLPPSRELARTLQVSRGSVASAYERLVAEGFLRGEVGVGTFVSAAAAMQQRLGRSAVRALQPRSGWTFRPQPMSAERARPDIDFRAGIPDGSLFPVDIWRRLTGAVIAHGHDGTYPSGIGLLPLRQEIARFVGYSRGVLAQPDDVLITNGTQHGLGLIGRVLVSSGDVVAVEEPGYPAAREVFLAAGAKVVSVPVDAEGIALESIPSAARVVYTTPSHQFPLGVAMSLGRRRGLLAWAARRGAAIVEDDYDSEFRFSDRPLQPLFTLDTDGRVIYAGTFSKILVPTVRMGFLVAPPSLRDALVAARQIGDGHGQITTQAALQLFMSEGHLGRHIRRATAVYAERRSRLIAGLRQLDDDLEIIPSSAGLHLCVRLRSADVPSAQRIVDDLASRGVAVETLASYCAGEPQAGLVIGYGAVRTEAVGTGISLICDAVRRVRSQE